MQVSSWEWVSNASRAIQGCLSPILTSLVLQLAEGLFLGSQGFPRMTSYLERGKTVNVCSSPKSGNAKCKGLVESCGRVLVVPSARVTVKTSSPGFPGGAFEQSLQTQSHMLTQSQAI